MKFNSLYSNPLPKTNYNNYNKIKVNKNNNNAFSPISNLRYSNNNKINNNKLNSNKTKNNTNINIRNSVNYINDFKDINYIKYISINVDIDKIKFIQIWWKYLYKIIFLQKNIRQFLIKKITKQKLKYYYFIISILKIFYKSFINNIKICYERFYFQSWKEINYKKYILNKILTNKKILNGKKIYSINNSFQNKMINDTKNSLTLGNIKKIVFNNSTILKEKILSPYRPGVEPTKPINIKINIKKEKQIACNLYTKDKMNNSLNKSLTNKSIIKKYSSNKRSKSNNKVITNTDNQSLYFDEKTEALTNNLYKNIKEYYNINELNVNPSISTINFYPSKYNKKKENKQKKVNSNVNSFNNSNQFSKKLIISNKKNNNRGNYNDFYKTNKSGKWIPYQHTYGNLNSNTNKVRFNYNRKNYNKMIHTTVMSPASNSNRNIRKNKNKSLEFDDNDLNSIKFLLKFKKTFLHWKNIIIKNKIIKRFRLIMKIKHIIYIYKLLNIKIFFAKIIQNIYKNGFYRNKINFNYILLNQYYEKLKDISKKKKLINNIHSKYSKKTKIKNGTYKSKKSDNKNKKNNNLNYNTDTNSNTRLYYATQFNQKFNKLLNDKKSIKNNNIIIINNNINNNCQQLINNVKEKKGKGIMNSFYYRKTVNNNSMIDIQPTDTSLSCTMDINNQSDKSLNTILINHINEKQKKIINKKNKKYYLTKIFKIINKIQKKKILNNYLNQWKINIIMKKCSMAKSNIIDEKIIHFPKPSSPNIINNSNINNCNYNYLNNYNYTYNNSSNNDIINNINYTYNNNDLIINAMYTENNIKNNKKNLYGNNNTLLRNQMFTPSNKYSFYTQYHNNENRNNFNYINPLPPRETEPKMIYHKKLFPSFCSSNIKHTNNSLIIDYNYNNNEDRNNISFNNNMSMNNFNYGKNIITNFYSNNNFFNNRNNYHLENLDNLLPEEKYGFKKINKIEEREISFSPSLTRKNHSFKNVIKDNYQNINNNNIYINVVENFRSDYQNQNININSLNDMKKINYGNKFYPINRSLTEEDNINKLMCHSHSQGFTKTIQRIFGN